MATTFEKQLESINTAALFFGKNGYHVEVSIYGKVKEVVLTIFYKNKSMKKLIYQYLSSIKDEEDVIEHQIHTVTFKNRPFYTWRLTKEEHDVY